MTHPPQPTILVTGATGFLGRHLIPALQSRGVRVRALVRPSSEVDFLRQREVELALADDITDLDGVTAALRGCTAVIHAAGNFRFWGEEAEFYRTNVTGTETVLTGCHRAGIGRMVHVSSIAVAGRIPSGAIIDEGFDCRPQDPYQKTKLLGEQRAFALGRKHQVAVVIVRPGAFYGPWGHYAFNRLFFEEPLAGWRIRVGRGRHIQFPAYVPDIARGICLALDKGRPGEIYNLSGRSLSHNEANHIISDLAGISRWRFNAPRWGMLSLAWLMTQMARVTGREPFYPFNLRLYVFQDWRVSIEKARRELGYEPTPFAEGAKETLAWYRNQRLETRD